MGRRRASPGMRDRYQLRLLAERNRFYGSVNNLKTLGDRGLVTSTGRTDETGRTEWSITEAGRTALRAVEP